MITCPHCSHQNPEGASQCEVCQAQLTATMTCPNCRATVQADASFCGACGFNFQEVLQPSSPATLYGAPPPPEPSIQLSRTALEQSKRVMAKAATALAWVKNKALGFMPEGQEQAAAGFEGLPKPIEQPYRAEGDETEAPREQPLYEASPIASPTVPPPKSPVVPIPTEPTLPPPDLPPSPQTQLQQQTAQLLHEQTDTTLELPQHLTLIHIGKPNDRIPPDIDVSGFADADVVSRVHADIRVEGGTYYIEDTGSRNGTYINHTLLPAGHQHQLRTGDRITLGKGDLVSFIFQHP